jgi:hypothetical protein
VTFEVGAMPRLQSLGLSFNAQDGASMVLHQPASSTCQASRKYRFQLGTCVPKGPTEELRRLC